jgi:hypothetical protein
MLHGGSFFKKRPPWLPEAIRLKKNLTKWHQNGIIDFKKIML